MKNNEHLERLLQSVREAFVLSEETVCPIDEPSEPEENPDCSVEERPEPGESPEEDYEYFCDELPADCCDVDADDDYPFGDYAFTIKTRAAEDDEYASIERVFQKLSTRRRAESASGNTPLGFAHSFAQIVKNLDGSRVRQKDDFDAAPRKMLPTLTSLAVCLLIMGALIYYVVFAHGLRAMMSVEQLEVSANAYSMVFDGDYGFDKFLESGGAASDAELMMFLSEHFSKGYVNMPMIDRSVSPSADNALAVQNAVTLNDALMGRSYNCTDELLTMVVTTRSDSGRESVSTVNLNWLGYTAYSRPDLFNRYAALASVYFPLDGMNASGLLVAALEVPGDPPVTRDTDLPDLTVTTAIRLLLDNASNVEQALGTLEQYDIFPSCGRAHHLLISDRTGDSVVVEWVAGKMIITESACAANGWLDRSAAMAAAQTEYSARRMDSLYGTYSRYNGSMTFSQVTNVMQYNSPIGDGWMVVYETRSRSAVFSFDTDDRRFRVTLH